MIFDPLNFYKSFQVNYYDYKLLSLKYVLNNYKELGFDSIIICISNGGKVLNIKVYRH